MTTILLARKALYLAYVKLANANSYNIAPLTEARAANLTFTCICRLAQLV